MSIFKRGGKYWYKFQWKGVVIRESTKQGNDKVARTMEAVHKTSLAKGEVGLRDKKPVLRFAQFLTGRIEPWAKTQPSWLWYRSGIRPALASKALSGLRLDEITSETIAGYAAGRQADRSHKVRIRTVAISSINRELRVIRRVLHLAVEWGELEKCPSVQMISGEKRRERVIGDEELERYLTCASPLLADLATILHDTGLRPDEAHRLGWEDITFVNGRHGNLRVRYGKTVAARRQLPLTPRVRALLAARWDNAGHPEEGWVFPAPTKSGHIDHSSVKKQHRTALKLSGVRSFVLYSLRHTFATRVAPHVDAWTLCKIMGWASLSVAMTYIHTPEDRVLDAFSALEGRHNTGHSAAPVIPAGSGELLLNALNREG
jgi:integrase